jgi:ribonuclease HII
MLLCGVDEAGRGAIAGPLVVGGVVMREDTIEELVRLGVKDSKLLSPNRRFALYDAIAKTCLRSTRMQLTRTRPGSRRTYVETLR